MKHKVSDLIATFLASKQISHVFGISGAGDLHIFDSIVKNGYTTIICPHHEQAATMAAHGYFFITGQSSAAILTTGGGAANGITGVLGAWMDSVPMLVISGNENSKYTHKSNPLRVYGVQGFEILDTVQGMVKYSARISNPAAVLYELEKAYYVANSGRKGPCWLDIPMNIQSSFVDDSELELFTPESDGVPELDSGDFEKVISELRHAERPLIWLGQGIRFAGASHLLDELFQYLQIPFLKSWSGVDLMDDASPFSAGRAGVYGQRRSNFALQNCDFLLTIGTRLAIPMVGYDLSEFARAAKIAIVDIDKDELSKFGDKVDFPIHADAKKFIEALIITLVHLPIVAPTSWTSQISSWRKEYPPLGPEHQDSDGFLNAYRFIRKLPSYFRENEVIVTDAGTAAMATHAIMEIKPPQRLGYSLNLGEMGWGLPGAIGASFGSNKGDVICINCDGSMMMNLQELQTIAHHQLPIKILVLCNDGYSSIKLSQRNLFQGRLAGSNPESGVSCPDFSKVAAAFGMKSFSIRTWDEMDLVIPEMIRHNGPCLCEIFIHPDQPFQPKLGVALSSDGVLVSPPLEDLGPLLDREEMRRNMIIGLHPKSEKLK
jgi:acetolactate synthase I/II/III large subunit